LLAALGAFEGAFVVGVLKVGPDLHSHLVLIVAVALGVFLTLGHPWLKSQSEDLPFGSALFGGYLLLLAIGIVSRVPSEQSGTGFLFFHAGAFAASYLLLLRIPLVLLACIPMNIWGRMFRATSPLWLYSSLAGVSAWALGFPIRSLYEESSAASSHFLQVLTFRSLEPILRLILPGFAPDSATYTIGTPRFSVVVLPSCSGMEGLGLVLVFTAVWLWYHRKECRFPQALLLIPVALVAIWVLNIVRLCVLTYIGDKISPEIALVGIHSHVGWITFIVVALTFFMATQRLSWVQKDPSPVLSAEALAERRAHRGESPVIRAYLVPFLAILAASFVSKSASGYFEWLYPLRFVAAIAALRFFWPELKKLNWRFGWLAPVTGAAVFVMWIAPSWLAHQHAESSLGSSLAALSPAARWAWIAVRVAAAVITVPMAEELAFRGYLARRFVNREFETVSFFHLTVLPVGLSSVIFGLMHMQNLGDWRHLMLGTVAGFAFALVLRWKGRMGDAAVAHATSNLLLALWVLILGDWAQW